MERKTTLTIVLLVVLVCLTVYNLANDAPATAKPKPQATLDEIERDDGKQPQRKQFIDDALAKGIFESIEARGAIVDVWPSAAFVAAPFKDKEPLAQVVFLYYQKQHPGEITVVRFRDRRTGQDIGKITKYGLTWND